MSWTSQFPKKAPKNGGRDNPNAVLARTVNNGIFTVKGSIGNLNNVRHRLYEAAKKAGANEDMNLSEAIYHIALTKRNLELAEEYLRQFNAAKAEKQKKGVQDESS